MPEKNITSDTPDFSLKDKVLHNNLCVFIIEGFGREKDGNRGKLIGSDLVIFCYKEFQKFALYKSVSQLEATFIVYS